MTTFIIQGVPINMTVERRLMVVVDQFIIDLRTKTTFKIFRRHLGKLMSRLN